VFGTSTLASDLETLESFKPDSRDRLYPLNLGWLIDYSIGIYP